MQRSNINLICTIFCLFIFLNITSAQEVIYIESFTVDGEGVTGDCTGPDISTCATNVPAANGQWSLTGNFAGMTATDDLLQTSGGSLMYMDGDAEVCFLSAPIDISDFENIVFEVSLREEGDLETADYIDVTYILDGTPVLIENFNSQGSSTHTLIGATPTDEDWILADISQMIPDGSELQVEVCFFAGAATELYFLDEVSVLGDRKAVVDPIPTMSQWALFILSLMIMSLGVVFISRKRLVEIEA